MDALSRKKHKRKKTVAFFYKGETGRLLTDGNIDFVNGNLDIALEKFKKAIQLSPTCHQAYFSIGLIHEEKDEIEKAYEFFKFCFNLKRKDENLLDKLYQYSIELGKKDETLYFLEKIHDNSKLDEMILLAKELNLDEKEQEFIIEKENDFSEEFLLNLSPKNLKKAISKIIEKFTDRYNNNKEYTGLFDNILDILYKNSFFKLISEISTKINMDRVSIKTKLIFAISQEKNKEYIISTSLNDIGDFTYDPSCKNLFFALGEYRKDILELLSKVNDLDIEKEAFKKLAEKAEFCAIHDSNHKCNLYYYLEYLKRVPDDNQIRLIVYSIYREKGDLEEAKLYSNLENTSFQGLESAVQFFKRVKDKKALRFSHFDCTEIRKIYQLSIKMRENFLSLSDEEILVFNNIMSLLLNDFFTNLYIFSSNIGTLKSFFLKNEKKENHEEIVYLSLHGLHTNEWLDIVKTNFHTVLQTQNQNCLEILFRSLDASIFRDTEHFFDLSFILIKYSVILNSLGYLNRIIKKLYQFKITSFNLYHFLLNFFIDYFNEHSYRRVYVNIRKIYFRQYKKTGKIQNNFIFLSTYVPFFVFPDTLDKLDKIYKNTQLETKETILLAIIFFNNAKSRRITNRNYFIKRGMDLMKSLQETENDGHVLYNLGRAYHHFGLNGIAEMYYKKCLDTPYKDIAKFNLILIYKKTNSFDLIEKLFNQE